jgi:drug/metabolite transporter (DMT)-like permease
MTPVVIKKKTEISHIFLRNKLLLFSMAVFSAVGYFAVLSALNLGEVSSVMPIVELSTIVAVLGGYFFHKEKDIMKRLLGTAIMIAGGILILRPSVYDDNFFNLMAKDFAEFCNCLG